MFSRERVPVEFLQSGQPMTAIRSTPPRVKASLDVRATSLLGAPALALVALCSACHCDPGKEYGQDEALPTIGSSASQLTRRLELPNDVAFTLVGNVLWENEYDFPFSSLQGSDVVHVQIRDSGDPFVVPVTNAGEGGCIKEDPTKDVDVRLTSDGGLFDEHVTAALSVNRTDGLVARFSLDELGGDAQSIVDKLQLTPELSAEWQFELHFRNNGSLEDMSVQLDVNEKDGQSITFHGHMLIGTGATIY